MTGTDGWTATRTVLDAGTTTYETEQLANCAQQRTTVGPDSTTTVSVQADGYGDHHDARCTVTVATRVRPFVSVWRRRL